MERLRAKKFRIAHQIADNLQWIWSMGKGHTMVYGTMTNNLKSIIEEADTEAMKSIEEEQPA